MRKFVFALYKAFFFVTNYVTKMKIKPIFKLTKLMAKNYASSPFLCFTDLMIFQDTAITEQVGLDLYVLKA